MRKILLLLLLLVLIPSAFAHISNSHSKADPVSRADIKMLKAKVADTIVMPGGYVDLLVSLYNDGDYKAEDVSITLLIPELGIKQDVSGFDLNPGERNSRLVYLLLPYDVPRGEYYISVNAVGGNDRSAKQVPIFVI